MANFIVSARKYRPATFLSVVGQNHITSTLKNAIERGQLAHAYLFCGPRGVGKTTCARIFAKAINCTDPRENEACGECESCRSFDQGRSFNIHELDAASNNSVDDIRNLTDQVRVPPQIGRYSVYIIDEVHMLSASAFNAFLKTLEEPPAHAIFILATTEKHKILPTILSRCQIFDFNRIRVGDSVGYMKHIAAEEGVVYDEESLNLIAAKADGGMRDALSMFDKAVSFCGGTLEYKAVAQSLNILDYDTYFDAADIILEGDYGRALMMFDRVLSLGFSGQTFASGLNAHLRDLLVARNPSTRTLLDVTGPLLERYVNQAARCEPELLFEGIALLTELDSRIRTAANQRLLVELALMKLCNLTEKKNSHPQPEPELPPLKPGAGTVKPGAANEGAVKPGVANEGAVKPGAVKEDTAQQESAKPEPTQEAKPEPAQEAKPEPAQQEVKPEAAKPETVKPETAKPEAAKPETAKPEVKKPAVFFTPLTGRPLSEILGGGAEKEDEEREETPVETPVDEQAQEKIEHFREKFLAKLSHERPRIGVVYETMEVSENTVRVRVASKTLYDEVMRHRTETLSLLAAVAGVHGPIELEAVVDETMKAARPIKIEDKLKHMAGQNPEFNDLRRALDLEVE